jgi:hypothetical protein
MIDYSAIEKGMRKGLTEIINKLSSNKEEWKFLLLSVDL